MEDSLPSKIIQNRFSKTMQTKLNTLFLLLIWLLVSCTKEVPCLSASDKLSDKTWYLDKHYTSTSAFLYNDSVTFSFHLSKNAKEYSDSDGIDGTYEITEQQQDISLSVFSSGRLIEAYNVTEVEKDHAVLEYHKNNILHIFYFSTKP
jgi:hypothetical protein